MSVVGAGCAVRDGAPLRVVARGLDGARRSQALAEAARMKVLVLSQYFWPEVFRINEIVESLIEAGCQVTVLTGQPNYPDGRIFPGYKATRFGCDRHEKGYTIVRVPLVPRGQRSGMRLAANYLSFVASASTVGAWLLRRRSFDVIFVYGVSPILQAIPAIVIGRLKKAAVVTWVQDLWPESLSATGFVRNQRVLSGVARVVRWIYRRSDLLLTQSRAFEPVVRSMAGGTPVSYHPNPGEQAFEGPVAPDGPALSLPAGFNVVFAGNLGTAQALETVLGAAELLQSTAEVNFVLIGSGSREPWLREQVDARGLRNVWLPGRYPSEAMPGILQQASALLVSLRRDPIFERTVPSKLQAYLAAGRPVVACLDGEGARVVLEADAGVACPAEDPAALAAAILRLRHCGEAELSLMGRNGRRYYESHFAPALLAHRLVGLFRSASGQAR